MRQSLWYLKLYLFDPRPCCAVDPVESEEDRNKALSSINTLLEKADKVKPIH